MHAVLLFLLQVFTSEKVQAWCIEFLKRLAGQLTDRMVAVAKAKRGSKMVEAIQEKLRAKLSDPEHAVVEKAGVFAHIHKNEGGLNTANGAYAGITKRTLGEFYDDNPDALRLNEPAEIETLTPEDAADFIYNFMDWYYQQPPKMNYFVLPNLLWLVVCDAAFILPAPACSRLQEMLGFEGSDVDAIWGSGVTARVQEYFEGQTVADIVAFAREFSERTIQFYLDRGQPQAEHLIHRCEASYEALVSYVEGYDPAYEVFREVTPESEDASPELPPVAMEPDALRESPGLLEYEVPEELERLIVGSSERVERKIEILAEDIMKELHKQTQVLIEQTKVVKSLQSPVETPEETLAVETPEEGVAVESPEGRSLRKPTLSESVGGLKKLRRRG